MATLWFTGRYRSQSDPMSVLPSSTLCSPQTNGWRHGGFTLGKKENWKNTSSYLHFKVYKSAVMTVHVIRAEIETSRASIDWNPSQLDWIHFGPGLPWVPASVLVTWNWVETCRPLLHAETTVWVVACWHRKWKDCFSFLYSVASNTFSTPPPPPHFRILLLSWGSLQIALWCIMWMQKSCHSLHWIV